MPSLSSSSMSLSRVSGWLALTIAFDIGIICTVALPQANADGGRLDGAQEEFFEAKVRPILAENCLGCHGIDKHKGGLRLDVREAMLKGGDTGPVVVPGEPDASMLIEVIRYEGETQMPPKKKLKAEEIAALTDWVKRGAFWPEPRPAAKMPSIGAPHGSTSISGKVVPDQSLWSLRPVVKPAPPSVSNNAWVLSPIDSFVLATLEQNKLTPAPPADKATLIRRAYFDLLGLPPAPEAIGAFINDARPDAYAALVDALLASPHYGERWGRYWLDIARYGEDQAHSFQPRLYPYGFRYRDWVVESLNHDMPYNRFILEQIAGDLIDGPDRESRLAALGFFACGPVYYGDSNKHDQYADRIDTLSRGFLGLTVACARCHDHKYDPISTADYYALAGVFASTEYVEVPAAPPEQVAAYNRSQAAIQAKDKEITSYLKAEAARLNQKLAGNQLKQIERMLPAESKAKVKALRADLDRIKKAAPSKFPVIHALAEASQPVEMPILVRGNSDNPGPKIKRRFLSALSSDEATFQHGSGRLELANAIVSARNPLTARVMVNRIWQHHFERGLVATCSNFGSLGDRPSHPELLDWLARRFVDSGWSIKSVHRLIMLSATYQQSSRFNPQASAIDAGNTLLWKMNRRRLDVEAWRDSMLAVAGRLDETIGGPSVSLDAPSNRRRTLYAAISRHDLAWMLRLFDFPDPNISSGGRVETTVPLQQLFVLNSDFMVANARAVSARLLADIPVKANDRERIRGAYRLLYGRAVTERELTLGREFLDLGASTPGNAAQPIKSLSRWEQYAQALLAANEFLFVD